MTSIEILATLLAILILVKVVIITINPKFWIKVAEAIMSSYKLTAGIYLILVVIVGYYIFKEFNIVQVAAVMLFTSILIGLGFLPFSKSVISISKDMLGKRSDMYSKYWLTILIWVGIAFWVLYRVFVQS